MSPDAPAHAPRAFHALVESMREAAVTVSPDATIAYANPSAALLVGLEREALVGHALTDLVPEEERPALTRLLTTTGSGTARHGELTLRAADGHTEAHRAVATDVEEDGRTLTCLVLSESATGTVPARAQVAEAARAERRQVAHEVNDTIVQGLVAAEMALDLGRVEFARLLIARTSAHARHWIGELAGSDQLQPGMAVRTGPARGGSDTP